MRLGFLPSAAGFAMAVLVAFSAAAAETDAETVAADPIAEALSDMIEGIGRIFSAPDESSAPVSPTAAGQDGVAPPASGAAALLPAILEPLPPSPPAEPEIVTLTVDPPASPPPQPKIEPATIVPARAVPSLLAPGPVSTAACAPRLAATATLEQAARLSPGCR
ncbi:hypothetical protein [Magnetospirillum sp. SS-4]|uniref:hypothetical protein n=1 Tax=Magnetospirillum sp. SS-4 TaxID=2681465 RepID=UPI00137CF571|nr:hypothetical protein [Magnetospirillum sp. SS-4]CAA7624110.1 exported hypothetical protein [Magnetospirillum sp. SS-4]